MGLIPRRGKIKEGCKFNKDDGTFSCESRRVMDDGSETEPIGVINGRLDANCNVIADEVWEGEEGVIDRLDNKFVKNIRGKCQRKPADF